MAESELRRVILDSALDAIVSIDAGGKVLDWNGRAEALFGWSAPETLGRPIQDLIIPPEYREDHERGLQRFLETGEGPILNHRLEISALRRDGSQFPVELTVAPAHVAGEWIFVSFIRDLSEATAAENRILMQSEVAGILAEDRPLEDAVSALLDIVLARTPWDACGFWKVGGQPGELVPVGMKARPDPRLQAFLAASPALRPPSGMGLTGLVQAREQSVWLANLEHDDFPGREHALAAGLKIALAFPVFIGGNVVGAFECYARGPVADPSFLETALVSVGRQLGQFLERIRAEEETRSRERQLQAVMDAAPALISFVDADGRYRFVNRAYEKWFGYSKESLAGRSVEEVVGPVAYELIRPRVDAALSGQEVQYEDNLPFKLGQLRYVQGHYRPLRRQDGTIEGFMVFAFDLTERKAMEEALRSSEERYRQIANRLSAIFNNVNDIILLLEVEGPDKYRILEANEVYLSQSVLPRHRILGLRLEDGFQPELYAPLLEPIRRVIETGAQLVIESTSATLRKHGLFEVRIAPIRNDLGKIGKILIVGRDITELRQREEELRQSQKMEAIGRLAGGIAHDFNNLLTAIKGFTQLALAVRDNPQSQQSMLGEVERAADRAADLTRQLLAFSRKQILAPKVLDVNLAVTGMEVMLRRIIGENLELTTLLAPGLRPVRMDPGQLEQVILNLALNARDAIGDGGRLTLETFEVEIGDEKYPGTSLEVRPGSYVALGVSDTGVGMSAEVKEHLFEPFFTTKGKGKGTGMGLATVYGIVKQSGGHIHVYSEPGKGSNFKIYFPAVEAPADVPDHPEAEHPFTQAHGESILLVEDEDLVRAYARKVLEGLGFRVFQAANGLEALEVAALAEGPIPILLTDVVMPKLSGRDLWEKLRVLHPEMRVIFMSGYADNAIVHQGVLDKDAPFLPKPFSPSQLAQKISETFTHAAPA